MNSMFYSVDKSLKLKVESLKAKVKSSKFDFIIQKIVITPVRVIQRGVVEILQYLFIKY